MPVSNSSARLRGVALLLAAVALGACQPGWVRLDGEAASAAELQRAQTACEVADKLAQLQASREADTAGGEAINDNEARMLRLEDYDSRKRRVQAEIEACMQRQGLRPG